MNESFNCQGTIRLEAEQMEQIRKLIKKHPHKYANVTHFIRCSVLKELNKYE